MKCLHCKEEIEWWDGAACGWVHTTTRRVMCRPTDATPTPKPPSAKERARIIAKPENWHLRIVGMK